MADCLRAPICKQRKIKNRGKSKSLTALCFADASVCRLRHLHYTTLRLHRNKSNTPVVANSINWAANNMLRRQIQDKHGFVCHKAAVESRGKITGEYMVEFNARLRRKISPDYIINSSVRQPKTENIPGRCPSKEGNLVCDTAASRIKNLTIVQRPIR